MREIFFPRILTAVPVLLPVKYMDCVLLEEFSDVFVACVNMEFVDVFPMLTWAPCSAHMPVE